MIVRENLYESAYNDDMMNEFGYFNQYLSEKLNKKQFKQLVEKAKIKNINYSDVPNIIMRYDEPFKELIKINKSEKEKLEWWKPKYLKMKKFEKEKQSDEYYYKLVEAIKDDKIDTPVIILSIDDESGKNYKFVCGGRNRMILSYILKKNIKCLMAVLPDDKKENIDKIIQDRNK